MLIELISPSNNFWTHKLRSIKSLTFSVGSILPLTISKILTPNTFEYSLFNTFSDIKLYNEKKIKTVIINTKISINT